MKSLRIAGLALCAGMVMGASGASAGCVTKGAIATAGSEKDAKWYVMETMVQAVSWSLWPGWLQNGKVAGHSVSGERYSCKGDGGQVTCRGRATFCTKG